MLAWRLLPSIMTGQLARVLVVVLSRDGLFRAYLSGIVGAWRLLPKMLKKRKSIQKGRRVSDDYVRRLLRESSRQAAESQRRRIRDQIRVRFER
jgi:hypothetical protein